jgi:hypothetical protein
MAQRLGLFNQWAFGEWADRAAINQNADDLLAVESSVQGVQARLARQQDEIVRLRAMLMGVVEVLHAKAPFDDAELDAAVRAAHARLSAPPTPAQRAAETTICSRCQRTVLVSATNITANGVVCDGCI